MKILPTVLGWLIFLLAAGADGGGSCPHGYIDRSLNANPGDNCKPCPHRPTDIMIIMDSSTSIKDAYEDEKTLVTEFIKVFNVSAESARFGVLVMDDDKKPEHQIVNFTSECSTDQSCLINAVAKQDFYNAYTCINKALTDGHNMFPPKEPERDQVIVFITDGDQFCCESNCTRDQVKVRGVSDEIRAQGVQTIAFGIGHAATMPALEKITGNNDNAIHYPKLEDFPKYARELQRKVCESTEYCLPFTFTDICEAKRYDSCTSTKLDRKIDPETKRSTYTCIGAEYQLVGHWRVEGKEAEWHEAKKVECFGKDDWRTDDGTHIDTIHSHTISCALRKKCEQIKKATKCPPQTICDVDPIYSADPTNYATYTCPSTHQLYGYWEDPQEFQEVNKLECIDGIWTANGVLAVNTAKTHEITCARPAEGCGKDPCHEHAICTEYSNGTHSCSCKPGFIDSSGGQPPNSPVCRKCSSRHLDVMIIMDSSGSIQLKNFPKERNFVKELIKAFNVDSGHTQIGVLVMGSYESHPIVDFGDCSKSEGCLLRKVDDLQFLNSLTCIWKALKDGNALFPPIDETRDQVIIFITDGEQKCASLWQPSVESQSNPIRAQGRKTFAIGIGPYVSVEALISIAGNKNNTYPNIEFEHLTGIIGEVQKSVCESTTIKTCNKMPTTAECPKEPAADYCFKNRVINFIDAKTKHEINKCPDFHQLHGHWGSPRDWYNVSKVECVDGQWRTDNDTPVDTENTHEITCSKQGKCEGIAKSEECPSKTEKCDNTLVNPEYEANSGLSSYKCRDGHQLYGRWDGTWEKLETLECTDGTWKRKSGTEIDTSKGELTCVVDGCIGVVCGKNAKCLALPQGEHICNCDPGYTDRPDGQPGMHCEPCSSRNIDILIIMDGSNSVKTQFEQEKEFVKSFISTFDVDGGKTRFAISMMNSSIETKTIADFDDCEKNTACLQNKVMEVKHENAHTCIHKALFDGDKMFQSRDPLVDQVIVFITDGAQNCCDGPCAANDISTKDASDIIQQKGKKIFVVGVGEAATEDNLYNISGYEYQRMFYDDTFADLFGVVRYLQGEICSATKQCVTIPLTAECPKEEKICDKTLVYFDYDSYTCDDHQRLYGYWKSPLEWQRIEKLECIDGVWKTGTETVDIANPHYLTCALEGCRSNKCSKDAVCENQKGGEYTCSCKPGFVDDFSSPSQLEGHICKKCTTRHLDILIVMDSSDSIKDHFPKEKEFVKNFIKAFNVDENNAHFGIVVMDDYMKSYPIFNFNTCTNNEICLLKEVDKIDFLNKRTCISKAITDGSQMFTPIEERMLTEDQAIIVITDGVQRCCEDIDCSVPSVQSVTGSIRGIGMNTFAVGIGEAVSLHNLNDISGYGNHSFLATTANELSTIVKKLQRSVCAASKQRTCIPLRITDECNRKDKCDPKFILTDATHNLTHTCQAPHQLFVSTYTHFVPVEKVECYDGVWRANGSVVASVNSNGITCALRGCIANRCDKNADCKDIDGGKYECTCKPGFVDHSGDAPNGYVCKQCTKKKLEIVIIMDGSNSIGKEQYQLEKDFVKGFIKSFNVAAGLTYVGIVLMNDDNEAYIDAKLDSCPKNENCLLDIVEKRQFLNGFTCIWRALEVGDGLFPKYDASRNQVIVFITDGAQSCKETKGAAEKSVAEKSADIRRRGRATLAVGIGSDADVDRLIEISGSADNTLSLTSVEVLNDVVTKLQAFICGLTQICPTIQNTAECPPHNRCGNDLIIRDVDSETKRNFMKCQPPHYLYGYWGEPQDWELVHRVECVDGVWRRGNGNDVDMGNPHNATCSVRGCYPLNVATECPKDACDASKIMVQKDKTTGNYTTVCSDDLKLQGNWLDSANDQSTLTWHEPGKFECVDDFWLSDVPPVKITKELNATVTCA